jgi:hypothetical protein
MKKFFIIALSIALVFYLMTRSCSTDDILMVSGQEYQIDPFWNNGKADIAGYELSQQRYGEMRNGEVVLVFVKEPFHQGRQIKASKNSGENIIPVMKLNQIRRFTTGIYDYQLMTSVFTPPTKDNRIQSLKLSHSTQEWCGQSYLQLNHLASKNMYKSNTFSYMGEQSDLKDRFQVDLLEDEIFNLIRLEPDLLPTGKFRILPAANHLRLMHIPVRSFDATGTIKEGTNGMLFYIVEIPEISRTVKFWFDADGTHIIRGWKEYYPGVDGEMRYTKASLKGRMVTPYWEQNGKRYEELREELNLGTSQTHSCEQRCKKTHQHNHDR